MIANYHTHTWRCNHAVGSEREYVEAGLKRGLRILGFSDHTPYIFPGEYYSGFRMRLDQLDEYVSTVLDLRKEFGDRLQMPLGLEVEFYPAYLPQLLPVLRDRSVEYLLLGQHFVGNEIHEHYSGSPTAEESILRRYCDQVIDAVQTGLFTYIAHPDLIHYVGDAQVYQRHMRRICVEAKNCGIPLEINLLGLAEGRNYPDRLFWELAAEEGCDCILGCDAHKPQALLDLKAEETALGLVREYDLRLLETAALRPIR